MAARSERWRRPDGFLSITDTLVVEHDRRHLSNLPHCACRCRQLLRVAVEAVAATAAVAGRGKDAAVLAAAIITARVSCYKRVQQFGESYTFSHLNISITEGVRNENSPDLSLGRRPEPKSDELLLRTPSVTEISRLHTILCYF